MLESSTTGKEAAILIKGFPQLLNLMKFAFYIHQLAHCDRASAETDNDDILAVALEHQRRKQTTKKLEICELWCFKPKKAAPERLQPPMPRDSA